MQCPKYIKKALKQRADCAYKFSELDAMIADWLEKHNLYDQIQDYDICGGCESYVNPYDSAERILEVIENG